MCIRCTFLLDGIDTIFLYIRIVKVLLSKPYRESQGAEPAGDRLNVTFFKFAAVI